MKVVILGGGISGLACAHFLPPDVEKVVLEENMEPGGLLHCPRGFSIERSSSLLQLAAELGLEVIFSPKEAEKRFIWAQGRLHALPGFFGAPWSKALRLSLLREWFQPIYDGEESIFDFGARRFGKDVAATIFDAMAVGVFGGSSHELSVNSCFPRLKQMEMAHGSLIKALLKGKKGQRKGLFSILEGPKHLGKVLAERLGDALHLGERVLSLETGSSITRVHTEKCTYAADLVISCLSLEGASKLFGDSGIPTRTVHAITCSYEQGVAIPQGFGYLVPRSEKSSVLGVCFDSHIFPQQNRFARETRFTIMTEGSIEEALKEALGQMRIVEPPSYMHVQWGRIPQYTLGHARRAAQLRYRAAPISLLGNYLDGVSVDDCVRNAKELVRQRFQGHKSHLLGTHIF